MPQPKNSVQTKIKKAEPFPKKQGLCFAKHLILMQKCETQSFCFAFFFDQRIYL